MLFENDKKWFIGTIGFSAACDFVDKIHRHNDRTVGHIFSLGLWKTGVGLVGVAICGRPTGRFLDDGTTIEVYRNCVKEGNKNACSMLYGAAIRTAKAKGFRSVVTFTLMSEPGSSTKAANFYLEAENVGSDKGWTGKRKYQCKSRELKRRWRYWVLDNYSALPLNYFKMKNENWISINDQLPDYDELVLWWPEDGLFFPAMIDKDDDRWWLKPKENGAMITHWKRINPPKD